jgi:2-amino-4-hydroxy-6-hydroxymethyldihydropteridine diphosphokinase
MAKVYFSLGSNEGDRLRSLVNATKMINTLIGKVIQYSAVIESEPWGFDSETSFYNMAIAVETDFTPHEILNIILDIEKSLGRIRHGKTYTNRIIDIDILFYGEEIINDTNLTIPHAFIHKRMFVLQPLAAVAPDLIHPVLHATIAELLLRSGEPGTISVVVQKEEFAHLLIQ